MMKKSISLLIIFIFISACSNEKKKLALFNPEAFTFNLEPGWELNASVRVKGYVMERNNDEFKINLVYYADIVCPESDTLKKAASGNIVKISKEEIPDVGINMQKEFDSTYVAGSYKIIFHVRDENSGQTAKAEEAFEITK